MAFCINCGREVKDDHRFCAVCGADQHPEGYNTEHYHSSSLRENDKALAIISYIGILSLVSYFVTPKTPSYTRFHAIQGLNLFIMECILTVSNSIFRGIFSWFWPLKTVISAAISIAGVGILILAIVGIVAASRGEMKELPIIGSLKIVKE